VLLKRADRDNHHVGVLQQVLDLRPGHVRQVVLDFLWAHSGLTAAAGCPADGVWLGEAPPKDGGDRNGRARGPLNLSPSAKRA